MLRRMIIRESARIIAIVAICFGTYYGIATLVHPTHITLLIDPSVSSDTATSLRTQIYQLLREKKTDWQSQLKTLYPIDTISCAIKKPQHMLITLTMQTPWLLTNYPHVITREGTLVNRGLFDTAYLNQPTVLFKKVPESICPSLVNWLWQHPLSFFSDYTVMITDQHTITITKKTTPLLKCTLESSTPYSAHHEYLLQKIYARLVTTGKIRSTHKDCLRADLRFHNQIILYQEKDDYTSQRSLTKRSLA